MSPLEQKIAEKIASEGPVNFEQFMDMALYYPGLGYYAREAAMIGKAGDFYTSPHLHPIFGAMIGRQMREMWDLMGRPCSFQIVEMGAGMGYLAKDMLDYLKKQAQGEGRRAGGADEFYPHIQYSIIELNPAVRARQQELLDAHAGMVSWISGLEELPSFSGCFVSNELLDAFPVRMVEMGDVLEEIYVDYERDKGFAEVKRECSKEVAGYFNAFAVQIPRGYRTEVNLKAREWLRSVGGRLAAGFVLTVDYGYSARDYYSEDRSRGTLLCYHQHRINENPYLHVGEQDLTAHVNFSSLKKWGEELGLATAGFASQGTYLVALGIDEAIRELYGDEPDPFETAKIKGLILPQGMGESHQVMVHCKGACGADLRGFGIRNQAKRL